jgi:hypothetical protein
MVLFHPNKVSLKMFDLALFYFVLFHFLFFKEFDCCLMMGLALCFDCLEQEQKVCVNRGLEFGFHNFQTGATIRIYLELYSKTTFDVPAQDALAELIQVAEQVSETKKRSGRNVPDVIS